jgi:hypothetical protein
MCRKPALALGEPCLVVFAFLDFQLRFGLSPNVVVIVIKPCAAFVIIYFLCFPNGEEFLSAQKKKIFLPLHKKISAIFPYTQQHKM